MLWYFPLQLIGTPGNLYNGRSRPGDRVREQHFLSSLSELLSPETGHFLRSVSFHTTKCGVVANQTRVITVDPTSLRC